MANSDEFSLQDRTFRNFEEVKDFMSKYQEHKRQIFVIERSDYLTGNDELKKNFVYSNVKFKCKFGGLNKTTSEGHRKAKYVSKLIIRQEILMTMMMNNLIFLSQNNSRELPSVHKNSHNKGQAMFTSREFL